MLIGSYAFGFGNNIVMVRPNYFQFYRSSSLFMGRAAAVRANTKARTDGAKAKTYGIFAKRIISSVKVGGPDASVNRQLGAVLADAKAANVPSDVIKRNIEKASSTSTADYKSFVFEYIGPGGTYIIVNVATDNNNRASQDVALVCKKNILKSGTSGSVLFQFLTKARLDINKVLDEDELMNICLENGVDDYELRTIVDGSSLSPKEEGNCVFRGSERHGCHERCHACRWVYFGHFYRSYT